MPRKYLRKRKYKTHKSALRMSRGKLAAMKRIIRLKIEAQLQLDEYRKRFNWKNPSWYSIAEQFGVSMPNMYQHRKRILRDIALEKLSQDVDSIIKSPGYNWQEELATWLEQDPVISQGGIPTIQDDTNLVH